ncbi:MAG: transposase [Moraxellaceae bacterium]|nr:transposase [Moraxellaceae bacterium]
MVYAQTGDVPIDNNPVENSIRPIAVGKKNWLFAGSERAGQRAAAIQSLLATNVKWFGAVGVVNGYLRKITHVAKKSP